MIPSGGTHTRRQIASWLTAIQKLSGRRRKPWINVKGAHARTGGRVGCLLAHAPLDTYLCSKIYQTNHMTRAVKRDLGASWQVQTWFFFMRRWGHFKNQTIFEYPSSVFHRRNQHSQVEISETGGQLLAAHSRLLTARRSQPGKPCIKGWCFRVWRHVCLWGRGRESLIQSASRS